MSEEKVPFVKSTVDGMVYVRINPKDLPKNLSDARIIYTLMEHPTNKDLLVFGDIVDVVKKVESKKF